MVVEAELRWFFARAWTRRKPWEPPDSLALQWEFGEIVRLGGWVNLRRLGAGRQGKGEDENAAHPLAGPTSGTASVRWWAQAGLFMLALIQSDWQCRRNPFCAALQQSWLSEKIALSLSLIWLLLMGGDGRAQESRHRVPD